MPYRGSGWSTQVFLLMQHVRDLLVDLMPSVELRIAEDEWQFDFGGPVVRLVPQRRHVDVVLRVEPAVAEALIAEFSAVAQRTVDGDSVRIPVRTPERNADTQLRAICRKFLLVQLESGEADVLVDPRADPSGRRAP